MYCAWSQKCSWVSTPHYAGIELQNVEDIVLTWRRRLYFLFSLTDGKWIPFPDWRGHSSWVKESDQNLLHICSTDRREDLKWQWWQQVDNMKWKCDSMFLALEEPMKMGLAWFVFSLSPLPHPSTEVMTSQLAVSWVCVTSMFASEFAATTRQSDGRVMLQLQTTCIKPLCRDRQMQQLQWRIQIDPKEEEKLMGIKGKLLQLVILMLGKEAWRHGVMK